MGKEVFTIHFKRIFTFTMIDLNISSDLSKRKSSTLQGMVKISDMCEKPATDLQTRSLKRLSNDLEQLLGPTSFLTDVTLKCGGVSLPAHKIILSARSPVFAAMFANPMKEILEDKVDINDIDESIVRNMLSYMYTGKTSNLTFLSSEDLLFAADKYQLEDLKALCSDFLKNTISPENVLKILVLGDMHDEDLKYFAVNYICNKCCNHPGEFDVLEKTEEWKTLRKERPDLTVDVLTSLVKSKDRKINWYIYRNL